MLFTAIGRHALSKRCLNQILVRHTYVSLVKRRTNDCLIVAINFDGKKCLSDDKSLVTRHSDRQTDGGQQLSKVSATEETSKEVQIKYRTLKGRNWFTKLILRKPNELIVWYNTTPAQRRRYYYYSIGIHISKAVLYMFFCISLFLVLFIGEHPITGREYYHTLSKELFASMQKDLLEELIAKYQIIASSDERVQRLDRCLNRLTAANGDLELFEEHRWMVSLMDSDDDELTEPFVMPHMSTIVVFDKMLDMVDNDSQLAYILAHHLAHYMLKHNLEASTIAPWYYMPVLIWMPKIWDVLEYESRPKGHIEIIDMINNIDRFNAYISKRLVNKIVNYFPFIEVHEQEADRIALQLLTRACFDVRECVRYHDKHLNNSVRLRAERKSASLNDLLRFNYIFMHPINSERIKYLNNLMKPFMRLRLDCNCEPLT